MTQTQRFATLGVLVTVSVFGIYFVARQIDPEAASNPAFSRSYFGSIGIALASGVVGFGIDWLYRQWPDDSKQPAKGQMKRGSRHVQKRNAAARSTSDPM